MGWVCEQARIQAECRGVAEIVHWGWQRGQVSDKIVAGIVAIEQIEEFDKRIYRPAVANREWPADAQVHLDVGSSAELVETSLNSVYHGAIVQGIAQTVHVDGRREGEGTGAFGLG